MDRCIYKNIYIYIYIYNLEVYMCPCMYKFVALSVHMCRNVYTNE